MDLITRRIISKEEGQDVDRSILDDYANPESDRYHRMLDEICKQLNFTTLRYHRLDDMMKSVGIDKCKLCTYCWDGKE